MSAASDYLEDKLVDHITGTTSFTMPVNVYMALCTAAPTDASTGTTITEAAYTSYARVECSDDWNASSGGTATNSAAITFPAATGGSETLTHFVLVDASSAGNVLVHGALDASLAVSSGITPEVAIGSLSVTVG